ncbi:MAG: TRAP transporter large permease subunit [Alphaproteobacteria bacterium]
MPFLQHLEGLSRAASRRIAVLAVVGMLAFAILTAVDVVLRRWTQLPMAGFNEILALILPITIVACFPAGVAERGHLTITFLRRSLNPRFAALLHLFGQTLLLVAFCILAWRVAGYALLLDHRKAETTILKWPLAPTFWLVAGLLAIAALIQLIVLANDVRDRGRRQPVDASPRMDAGGKPRGPSKFATVIAIVSLLGAAATILGAHGVGGLRELLPTNPSWLAILLFAVMWGLIVATVPLGAAMIVAGLTGTIATMGIAPALMGTGIATGDFLANVNIAILPLFLMMGSFAVAAGLSADLYRLAQALLGHLKGGLALATIGACAGFGAVTGLSVATAVTIGRVALPEMRSRGYSPALSTGSIAAGGTLGILIPPSGAMILYALLTDVSIGQMFIGALIPAVIAVSFYMLVIVSYVRISPSSAPPTMTRKRGELLQATLRSWGMFVMFGIVIGGIYTGVFTETEAAAVGAGFAFVFALMRGKLKRTQFWEVVGETVQTTSMIFLLLIGGMTFSFFIAATGLAATLKTTIEALQIAPIFIIAIILGIYLILGCVMDSYAAMVITVPIFAPLISAFGYDLVWWGIVMVIVIEVGLLSPPFGVNAFVLKGLATDVPLGTIFKGITPFMLSDVVRVVVLVAFPVLVTWLPSTMK